MGQEGSDLLSAVLIIVFSRGPHSQWVNQICESGTMILTRVRSKSEKEESDWMYKILTAFCKINGRLF